MVLANCRSTKLLSATPVTQLHLATENVLRNSMTGSTLPFNTISCACLSGCNTSTVFAFGSSHHLQHAQLLSLRFQIAYVHGSGQPRLMPALRTIFPLAKMSAVVFGSLMRIMTAANRCTVPVQLEVRLQRCSLLTVCSANAIPRSPLGCTQHFEHPRR